MPWFLPCPTAAPHPGHTCMQRLAQPLKRSHLSLQAGKHGARVCGAAAHCGQHAAKEGPLWRTSRGLLRGTQQTSRCKPAKSTRAACSSRATRAELLAAHHPRPTSLQNPHTPKAPGPRLTCRSISSCIPPICRRFCAIVSAVCRSCDSMAAISALQQAWPTSVAESIFILQASSSGQGLGRKAVQAAASLPPAACLHATPQAPPASEAQHQRRQPRCIGKARQEDGAFAAAHLSTGRMNRDM